MSLPIPLLKRTETLGSFESFIFDSPSSSARSTPYSDVGPSFVKDDSTSRSVSACTPILKTSTEKSSKSIRFNLEHTVTLFQGDTPFEEVGGAEKIREVAKTVGGATKITEAAKAVFQKETDPV
jgi:hypothetical protein